MKVSISRMSRIHRPTQSLWLKHFRPNPAKGGASQTRKPLFEIAFQKIVGGNYHLECIPVA